MRSLLCVFRRGVRGVLRLNGCDLNAGALLLVDNFVQIIEVTMARSRLELCLI